MDPRGKKEERLVKEQHGGELKDMNLPGERWKGWPRTEKNGNL